MPKHCLRENLRDESKLHEAFMVKRITSLSRITIEWVDRYDGFYEVLLGSEPLIVAGSLLAREMARIHDMGRVLRSEL